MKKIITGILILLLALGGVSFYLKQNKSERTQPRRSDVIESIYGLATVVAPQTYQVRSGVGTAIRKIYVQEGDTVTSGQSLILFDDSVLAKAPFSGTIASIPFKEGEVVSPQTALLTLMNLKNLYLEISFEQQSVLHIKAAQTAKISFESLRNEKFTGKVVSIYPRENQFIVRVIVDRFPTTVLPGMTADVAIEIEKRDHALLVPAKAIIAKSFQSTSQTANIKVFRASKGHAELVSCKIGVTVKDWVEVSNCDIADTDLVEVAK